MPTYRGPWSAEQVESFVQSETIPLRLACSTPSDRLWIVSLWYQYRQGTFRCATERSADVVDFLEHSPHVAFEVSTNHPPYKGIRGNGHVTVEPDPEKTLLKALLERYLGGTDSKLANRLLEDDREECELRIEPNVIVSWDFTERMQDA